MITRELGVDQSNITLYSDSQSALHLSKNQMFHERTKHIDVRFHFIREVVSNGKVTLLKVSTEENAADALTKALPNLKFNHCLKILSVVSD